MARLAAVAGAPAGAAAPSPAAAAAPSPRPGPQAGYQITAFRKSHVTMFTSEFGNEGERVALASLSLPLAARTALSNGQRVEVATIQGPRWVAVSDIQTMLPVEGANTLAKSNP